MISSDAKRLFAPVADKGGGHTEADEYATRDVTFPAQIVPIALDPSPSRGGDQCIKSITRQAHQRKQQTEKGDLERHRDARSNWSSAKSSDHPNQLTQPLPTPWTYPDGRRCMHSGF